MSGSQLAIKNRIRSIDSTKKITKAMQLVAASKYQRQKERMRKNKEYATELKEVLDNILSTINNSDHPYLTEKEDTNPCTIIYTSDMGLCGGFNANIFKLIESECTKEESIIMLGGRGATWIKNKGYNVIDTYIQVEDDDYSLIAVLVDELLEKYASGEITSIHVVYTEFKNPLTFIPKKVKLLPVESVSEGNNIDTIFEPSGEEILNDLVPMSIKSLLYSYFLETKTSEQASRRTSMENATDNAEELKETLSLQYNQARQAAITQEITEIVAGSSAH